MLIIIELTGPNTSDYKEERCFYCETEPKAQTMHRWLRDNHIQARAISQREYDVLPHKRED